MLLSLLLWLQVQSQNEPTKERSFEVPLQARNLDEEFIVTRGLDQISVVATGTPQELDKINPDEINAYVDLSQARLGASRYEVRIQAPIRLQARIKPGRERQLLEVSRVTAQTFPVTRQERGLPPSDLQYSGATLEPDAVVVRGPENVMKQVRTVRVMLDLSKIRPSESLQAAVEILGVNNQALRLVTANPSAVTIRPGVTSAPVAKSLLVSPVWKGQPAFGFAVVSYSIRPNQVSVGGPPSTLALVQKVSTRPIDITELKSSTTLSVPIEVPAGVRAVKPTTVRVTVQIDPQPPVAAPGNGPTPSSPGGDSGGP